MKSRTGPREVQGWATSTVRGVFKRNRRKSVQTKYWEVHGGCNRQARRPEGTRGQPLGSYHVSAVPKQTNSVLNQGGVTAQEQTEKKDDDLGDQNG